MAKNNVVDIVKKWSPVLINMGIKNTNILELLSIYCDKHDRDTTISKDLPENLNKVISKLKKRTSKLKIANTYYNPLTCSVEYELENGTLVDNKLQFIDKLSLDELVEIFGVEFIRELDTEKYRDHVLNNILDDEKN